MKRLMAVLTSVAITVWVLVLVQPPRAPEPVNPLDARLDSLYAGVEDVSEAVQEVTVQLNRLCHALAGAEGMTETQATEYCDD